MKMKKTLLTSAVALALLGGCNNDYDGQDIAGSKLVVSASIDQVNTRVSDTGTEWTIDDAIGVSDNLSNPNVNIKYVAGSTTGNFASATGIYILGNDEVTYTAYYPYAGNEGVSADVQNFKITDAEGKYVGHAAIDFMYAKGTASRSNPNVNFRFKHMMSKLSLDITDSGAAATKAETPISYTLKNVIVDGTFNTETGEVKSGSTKGNVTVDATLGAASSIILPPVATSADGEAEVIELLIKVGDKAYSGSLNPALSGSQEYQYSIDLSQTTEGTALKIDSPTIEGWTPNDNGNLVVKEEINYNPTLEVGDFFCTDGTTIDKDYDLATLTDKTVAAVVYYVGNAQPSVLYEDTYTETQDILKNKYSSCTNGLAIALSNATSSSEALSGRFGSVKQDYKSWLESQDIASQYISATLSTSSAPNKILGYNNTKVMELASAAVENLGTDLVDFLTTYRSTINFGEGVASEWYLPSFAELNVIRDNYDAISASIKKAGGELANFSSYDAATEQYYWSSDCRGTDKAWVSPLITVDETKNLYIGRVSSGMKGFFRFAIAF